MSMKALKSQSKAGAASKLARMGRFAKGGKVADGDADDKPVMKAKKPSAPIMVDGKPARARLDQPGRRMKRAEGGPAWQGEGDSGKTLKEKAADEHDKGIAEGRIGVLPATIGSAIATGMAGRTSIGRGLAAIAGAAGAGKLAQGFNRELKSRAINAEADQAEGRKRGGHVK